jgi:hypothetical protein
MAKKNKSARLADTEVIQGRLGAAKQLEKERFEVICEIEKIMAEYAKLTGEKSYAKRKYKLGKAPNDFKGQ